VLTRARMILVTSVCLAGACLAGAGFARTPEPTAGVIVHEWGTFTSIAGKDGRAIEWLALDGPADLPCFVERARTVLLKTTLPATVRMETPVLYFYAPRETTVDVRVGFRQGAITEYFPRATVEPPRLTPTGLTPTGLSQPGLESAITWRHVRILPAAAAAFRSEPEPNHYYAARETDAAPVEVGPDRERFLFYRGIGSFALPIAATVGASDAIAVTSLGRHEIPALMLFENRGGRIGHRVHDRATREVRLAPPDLRGDLGSTRAALERMLVAQGLYPKEAAAMTETWRDSWFEEGTRLLYVVPPAVVDAVLPLRIDPAPARLARVFVGRLELATEATLADVRTIARSRDRASEQKYGRFLRPFVERLLAERLAPADRARVESLMTRASAPVTSKASPCP
jgi:hypothetical protein